MKKIKKGTTFLPAQESIKMLEKAFFYSTVLSLPKLRSHFIITAALILLSIQGFSQGMMAPPSPNAQALARYAAVPVNYYTGIPSISVPLYTLPGKELSVPISLSYHAGGNKVQDVASWVGLGWSLNAGGVITRMVRGLPDEDPNGYCGVNNIGEKAKETLPAGTASWDYLVNVANGTWDGEPDVFYFNFLGTAGRFVIDASGKAYTTPYRNVKISTGICNNGNTEWIITDESGTKYYFGTSSLHRETSSVNFSSTDGPSNSYSYTSSWYLSRIESANSTDNIYFSYTSGSNIVTVNKAYRKYDFLGGDIRSNCDKYNNETMETTTGTFTTQSPKYISSISSNYGTITFTQSSDTRDDLDGGRKLEKIIIKDKSLNNIDSYSLKYAYFISSGCSSIKCKRLKLNGILNKAQPMVNFAYNETVNLPARDSDDFDHWGYYSNVGGKIPGVQFNGVEYTQFNGTIFFGVNRQTNPNLVGANLIESIAYPSGQATSFNFEANQYYNQSTSSNKYAGGVRIKQITVDPGNGQTPIETNYEYAEFGNSAKSSGLLYDVPKYWNMVTIQEYGANSTTYASHYMVRYSSSLNLLYDLGGVHLGYTNVTENTSLNEVRYSFYDIADFPDTENLLKLWVGTDQTLVKPSNWEKAPEPKKNSFFWKRGQLKSKKIFDLNENILSNEIYNYQFNTSVKKQLAGVYLGPAGYLYRFSNCNSTTLAKGSYFEKSQPFYLTKQTTEVYDQSNPTLKTTSVKEFVYNTQGQLSETKAYNLAQTTSKQITKTKYINDPDYSWSATEQCNTDYANCLSSVISDADEFQCEVAYDNCLNNLLVADSDSKAILDLRIKHAINVPVEQLSILEEGGTQYLVGATYAKFKTQGATGQMVVPYQSYVMDKLILNSDYTTSSINNSGNFIEPVVSGAAYELVGTSNFSTTTGQLTSQTGNNGTTTTNMYESNGILSSTVTTNDSLSTTASQIVAPLVGVTQKTDANGRQVNYTYDTKGRLKYVKDHNNNVVTRYRYNTETPLTSEIEIDGTFLVGDQINFAALNPFDHGVSTITWGFDDGNVLENSSESVSHSFSSTGLYNISFTITNPEYKSLSISKSIAIYTPVSITGMMQNGNAFLGDNACATSEKIYSNFSVNVTGGSPNKTFEWSYKLGTNNSVLFEPNPGFSIFNEGTYVVKCVVTDEFNNSEEITRSIIANNTNCKGGGIH